MESSTQKKHMEFVNNNLELIKRIQNYIIKEIKTNLDIKRIFKEYIIVFTDKKLTEKIEEIKNNLQKKNIKIN